MNRGWYVLRLMILVVVCSYVVYAQDDQLPDLEHLDPDTFQVEDDLTLYQSTGWFPRPYAGFALTLCWENGNIWERASDIRSAAFVPTRFAFSHRNPYGESEEREVKEAFSEDNEDAHIINWASAYTLMLTANLPFPAVLRVETGLFMTDAVLFSSDRTRSFLTYDGTRRDFHEVGVVYLEEWLLKGSVGLNIPVYGAYLIAGRGAISSYYYVHGGMTGLWQISNRGTQYAQIADAKDDLRYANGTDTVRLQPRRPWDQVNTFRTAVSVGIGWNVAAHFFSFSFEPFVMLPVTSVLDDAEWKQVIGGVRMSIGYQWGTGKW
jgi:hypothetical protein